MRTYSVKKGRRWVAVHFDEHKNEVRAADTGGRGGYRTRTGSTRTQVESLVRDNVVTWPTLRDLLRDYPDAQRWADCDV